MKLVVTSLWILLVAAWSGCATTAETNALNVTVQSGPGWAHSPAYLNAILASAKVNWSRNIAAERLSPPSGTTVAVSVNVFSDGGAPTLLNMEGGGAKTRQACAEALTRQQLEAWSPGMVQVLGTSQRLTFTFVYP